MMPEADSAEVSFAAVRFVFILSTAFFFFLGIFLRRFVMKARMTSIIEIHGLIYIATAPTMGLLAIWAAWVESVRQILPMEIMLTAAGLASFTFGLMKIIDPILNKDYSDGPLEIDLPGSQKDDNDPVSIRAS